MGSPIMIETYYLQESWGNASSRWPPSSVTFGLKLLDRWPVKIFDAGVINMGNFGIRVATAQTTCGMWCGHELSALQQKFSQIAVHNSWESRKDFCGFPLFSRAPNSPIWVGFELDRLGPNADQPERYRVNRRERSCRKRRRSFDFRPSLHVTRWRHLSENRCASSRPQDLCLASFSFQKCKGFPR